MKGISMTKQAVITAAMKKQFEPTKKQIKMYIMLTKLGNNDYVEITYKNEENKLQVVECIGMNLSFNNSDVKVHYTLGCSVKAYAIPTNKLLAVKQYTATRSLGADAAIITSIQLVLDHNKFTLKCIKEGGITSVIKTLEANTKLLRKLLKVFNKGEL